MNEKERAAMQQALEALEAVDNDAHGTSFPATVSSAITDLCAALAQQPEPAQDERTTIADLRCAKWLDPECADEGACQSLKFKRPAEPAQEPVAKVELMTTGGNAGLATRIVEIDDHLRERLRPGQLLYAAPPQRPPLTDKDMLDIIDDAMEGGSLFDLARAIERKVRGE